MGIREDFLSLFNRSPQKELPPREKEKLKKDHEEITRLLKYEEALSRELTNKKL